MLRMGQWIGQPNLWQRIAHAYFGPHRPWPQRRVRNERAGVALLVVGIAAAVTLLALTVLR
jgi:hypothetical protein